MARKQAGMACGPYVLGRSLEPARDQQRRQRGKIAKATRKEPHVVPQKAVRWLCGTFAGLTYASLCFPVLDDRNGRPATEFSINSLPTESDSCDFGILPNFAAAPPDRPYKAKVGGSRPSAPTI